jgi:tetratricopeptide (TPR) repeat protein
MTRRGQTVLFAIALVAMLMVAAALQVVRDRAFAFDADEEQVLYIRSGAVIEKAALSYDALLADVYWIRALQHYGRERLKPNTERRYDLLYPLLDLATTLDSRFTVGYRFGAIFLAEPHPGGAGRPDQAIALLKKGIALDPAKWDYYHDVGFIYYWNLHDYHNAAEWFRRGGGLPGAPWWLNTYAAVMLTRGGDRQASRAMWHQLRETAENDWLRQTADLRLMQLDALDQIDGLETVVRESSRLTGERPQSWEQLVAARLIRGIPVDPTGTPYSLNSATGDVTVNRSSKLHPLPTEPAAAPELRKPEPPAHP